MCPVETRDENSAETGEDTPSPGALVVFSDGLPELRTLCVGAAGVVLGRDDVGGLALSDERMSRRHAEITFEGGRFGVRDLDSRNGTFLDGVRVAGTVFAVPPAVLRVGSTLLVLRGDIRPFDRFDIGARAGFVVGPLLEAALGRVERAARAGGNLLVTGESGSGKELAARTFHQAGSQAGGPFVAVNCAAIPEGVAERLLFGARKGAYSGAVADVTGYVQTAHGGTLFLDEMGDLDLAVQAKLLRMLEAREVLPLGASRAQPVVVRVCSATHKDLRRAIEDGRFRADLYYRVGFPEVRLPPLCERLEEIPWLVSGELARAGSGLRADAKLVEACLGRLWPGNVRELLAEIRQAADLALASSSRTVLVEHLTASAGQRIEGAGTPSVRAPSVRTPSVRPPSARPPDTASLEAVRSALAQEGGNVAATARALGLHRTQLYRLMKRFGLDVARQGDSAGHGDPPP